MARSFNGSTDKIDCGTGSSVGRNNPWSAAAWVNPSGLPAGFAGVLAKRDTYGATTVEYELYIRNVSSAINVGASNGSRFVDYASISTGVWTHIGCSAQASGLSVYAAGSSIGSDGNDYSSGLGSGTKVSLGFTWESGVAQEFFPGLIAEVALWSAALSAAEFAALALGYSPFLIRPASLVSYKPLIGRTSPEIDIVGATDGTLSGTSAADHPRIIMPSRSPLRKMRFTRPTGASTGGGNLIGEGRLVG